MSPFSRVYHLVSDYAMMNDTITYKTNQMYIGPKDAVIVFNNLVVGGFLLGKLCALVKFIIERTKVAEVRQRLWGRYFLPETIVFHSLRMFWALGHVITNILHALNVLWMQFRGGMDKNFGVQPST